MAGDEPEQVLDGKESGNRGCEKAHSQAGIAHVVVKMPHLDHSSAQDDWDGHQKTEARGRFAPIAQTKTRGYRDTAAGDAGDDRHRLTDANPQCVDQSNLVQILTPPAIAIRREEDKTETAERRRDQHRIPKKGFRFLLQQFADDGAWDAGKYQEPGHALVDVALKIAGRWLERMPEAQQQQPHIAAEINQHGHQRAPMQGDVEAEAWIPPSEKPWHDDEMGR